jgi:predicted phage terminase large subunit-like protein
MIVDTDKVWARVWDLAHTAAQRTGDDPDWTSGTKMAFEMREGDPVPFLYVADVARTREGAVKRDQLIRSKVLSDGIYVRQAIENTIDSKDAYAYISSAMPEFSWTTIDARGDKGSRATPLEAIFATPGHVIAKKGEWNDEWISEIMRFDGSGQDHDDQVDNLSAGYSLLVGAASWIDDQSAAVLAARRKR